MKIWRRLKTTFFLSLKRIPHKSSSLSLGLTILSQCSNIKTDNQCEVIRLEIQNILWTFLPVLLPPFPLVSGSKLERDVEPNTEQEVASLPKSLASSSSTSSTRSTSSCKELATAVDLSSATGRLRRESHSQTGLSSDQVLLPVLARHTTSILNDLVLIPTEQSRPSVIAHTPSRSPRTSTPSTFPQPPPVPPRNLNMRIFISFLIQ